MIGSQELMNERGDQKKLESKNKLLFEQRTGYIKDYQHNLSSDLESYNNLELEASNVNNNNDVDIKFNPTTFFVIFVLQYITYLVYVVFIPFIVYKDNFINSDLAYLKEKTWAWICLWSVAYQIILFYFFPSPTEGIHYLLQDEILFIFSTFLIFSYVRSVDMQQLEGYKNQFRSMIAFEKNICQLVYFHNIYDSNSTQLDYNNKIEFQMSDQFPAISINYTLMSINKKTDILSHHITTMFDSFNDYLPPNFKHFYILLSILSLKLFFILLLIYNKQSAILNEEIVNISLIFFVYIFVAFNLNRTLGSSDLRKKTKQMDRFSQLINFKDLNHNNYKSKLDITCPISFESWDVARKFILGYKKSYLEMLDISYLGLLFYFLFVIVVCISGYFEINWLIPKDSPLLKPVAIIINTINFIFLTVIFILRLNQGTQFNKSFSQLLLNIQFLQNIIADLNTMFPIFFLQDKDSKIKDKRYSAYGIIVKRFKVFSSHFIDQKIYYNQKIFTEEEKQDLRKLMVQNTQVTLQKIKESIELDSQLYAYKFINVIEIDNKDFILTILLGMASALPQIIPKFISFYKN